MVKVGSVIVEQWNEVVALVAEARNQGRMLTNFFADEARMAPWCDQKTFLCEKGEVATFFLHVQEGFTNIYFLVREVEALGNDLGRLMEGHHGERLVVDVLGPDRVRIPLEEVFAAKGFEVQTVLQRMGRKTPQEAYEAEASVACATVADVPRVHDLLTAYFNAEQEQLPTTAELAQWAESGGLRVVHGAEGDIFGFVIFDLSPAQLYLRYWFVHPEARGAGVGGRLLRTMFAAGSATRRQYFWVKTDNEAAILRYRHYGFEFEPMKDVVLACGQTKNLL